MKLTLLELIQKLGAAQVLSPYENMPWSVYEEKTGRTCSAEIRMNPDGNEIEAELQIIHDTPPAGRHSLEQVLWLKGKPDGQSRWGVTELWLKRENAGGRVYNWEEKCCNFFRACVVELDQGRMPDVEGLLEKEFHDKERFGGTRGGGGGKSPKIRPEQVMKVKPGF